ncbi:MAG: hypothetical protein C4278_02045 [Patescibacteria group bacterium]
MRGIEKNEVNEAFEIFLEEIEAIVNTLNEEGAQAFQASDYEKAKSAWYTLSYYKLLNDLGD